MEKKTAHYDLEFAKTLIQQGKVKATYSALTGASILGIDFDGMIKVILSLTQKDFYKSMTTHNDYKIWQDVYRPTTEAGDVYLKLTVIDEVLVVSFKEL